MKWERDKKLHAVTGLGISLLPGLLLILTTSLAAVACAVLSFLLAAAVGWVKEYIYDVKRPDRHTVDKNDFYATALGGAFGSVLLIVLDRLFQVAA